MPEASSFRVDPIADAGWNSALASFPEASIFHTSAWARTLRQAYGFTPVYLLAREGGSARSLLPLMEVDSWLTGRRGVSLPFSDECAPLGADGSAWRRLREAAVEHGRRRGWRYWECRGGRARFGGAPASASFFGHRLNLQAESSVLFSRFDNSVRQAIRKAGRSGLTVEFSRELPAVRAFYGLLCQTRGRQGVPPQPFRFFSCLQHQVLAPGHGWVVLARAKGRPVAGAVFLHFGQIVHFKYGASDQAFQHLRPNNLVMGQAIERYAGENFATLDFGRTAPSNAGLRKFKLGWGAIEQSIDYVRLQPRTGDFSAPTRPAPAWRGHAFDLLPAWLRRLAGAALYRHAA